MTLDSESRVRPDDAGVEIMPPLQRAIGELAVGVKTRGGATVLDRLRQSGCLKARLTRPIVEGWADIVTLNTSGGIAGGDRLDSRFVLQPGARATIAAQAAERFYRAPPGSAPAQLRTRIHVAEGAAAEWLPQDTIVFDRCAASRSLDVELAESGWFTGVETLVFGRSAMGERVHRAWLRDLIRVRRGGRLLLHDAVRLDGAVHDILQRRAVAGGACAVATVVHVAGDAADHLESVRSAVGQTDAECGVSAWDGMLVARILAAGAAQLRRAIIAVLHVLRDARPLPRVWLC